MLYDKPARRWQAALVSCVVLVVVLTTAAVQWAFFFVPATPPIPAPNNSENRIANVALVLHPDQWDRPSWKVPEVKPIAKVADKPWEIRVVGVLHRQGALVAAIEPAKGQPLLFIPEGETRNEISVSRITTHEVEVEWSGEKRTLGVKP